MNKIQANKSMKTASEQFNSKLNSQQFTGDKQGNNTHTGNKLGQGSQYMQANQQHMIPGGNFAGMTGVDHQAMMGQHQYNANMQMHPQGLPQPMVNQNQMHYLNQN